MKIDSIIGSECSGGKPSRMKQDCKSCFPIHRFDEQSKYAKIFSRFSSEKTMLRSKFACTNAEYEIPSSSSRWNILNSFPAEGIRWSPAIISSTSDFVSEKPVDFIDFINASERITPSFLESIELFE